MEYENAGPEGDYAEKPRLDFRGNPMPEDSQHDEYNNGHNTRNGDYGYPDDGYGGDGNYNSEHPMDDPMDGGYNGHGGFGGRGGPYRGGFQGRGMPPGRGFPPGRGQYQGHGFFPPGQPERYGGPPEDKDSRLKRLAGCVEGEELWVETEADGGKKYYYHAITRETVWERPLNAKVINQIELSELIQRCDEEERRRMDGYGNGYPPPQQQPPHYDQGVDDAWSEFTAPDGRKYYYNSVTQENTWEKPRALLEREGRRRDEPQQPVDPGIAEAQAKAQAALQAYMEQQRRAQFEVPTQAAQASPAQKTTPKESKNKDPARPVSSTPIGGTPWCVVWTGDSRVFFYNPSTKTSVWERPPELYGRPDVDKLVSECPAKKEDEGTSEEESDDGGPPKKKSRAERKREALLAQQKKDKENRSHGGTSKPVDPAIQAELEAQKKREKLPLEERLKQFKEMLGDKQVATNSTFEKELSKIVFDPRYLLLSATERRACFEAFCREKAETERAERKKRAKEAKEKFTELLKEADLHGKSSFSSFASKFGKDERFKAVEKMRDKEDIFNDYVGVLHKKEKEEKREKKEKAKKDFIAMLEEQTSLTRKSKWKEVKKILEEDERYKNLDSSSTREELFKEYISKLGDETLSDIEEEEARQKRLATEEAIAARQKEVEAELGDRMKERDRESEKHRQQEHEERFRALLMDLVKQADTTWHDARRALRKDERYNQCDLLDKENKEKIFGEHIKVLEKKRREKFFAVLDEHPKITIQMRWKDARKIIVDEEETFSKVASNSERKVERDFRDWQDERHDFMVQEFKQMLRETRIITYKSKNMIDENEQHLKDILAVLENDMRWKRLSEAHASERDRILEDYIDELHRKGTPPPPTQTERESTRPDRR